MMSEAPPEWQDTDSGTIVKVISEGQFLVDKGFSVGREVMVADAAYVNTLERKAAQAEALVQALARSGLVCLAC